MVRDKAVGKTPGPCEITALLADAAILKDCCSVDVVASSLDELNNMWQVAFDTWAASADLSDFEHLHQKFELAYKALLDGNTSEVPWIESVMSDTTVGKELQRYQECLLRSTSVKQAATAMSQHILDAVVTAQIDAILKSATLIVGQVKRVELMLASVTFANCCLEQPRPKDFKQEFAGAVQFVTAICKVKTIHLPAYVQTLHKAEIEAQAQPGADATAKAKAQAATKAKGSAAAFSSKAADSEPAPAERSKNGAQHAFKKIKLSPA